MANNFDLVAQEWDANPLRIELAQHVIAEIKKNVTLHAKMDVLDYGTGTGLILLGIQPDVANITGMDSSQGMLDVLKEKISAANIKNVTLQKHNIETEELGINKYDLIVTNMTLHHISNTSDFLEKACKALKTGGILCITDLETEDGTFHQNIDLSIKHLGFDKQVLENLIDQKRFSTSKVYTYYSIKKPTETEEKEYPVFIAVAIKE